jgi:hypothetical protein
MITSVGGSSYAGHIAFRLKGAGHLEMDARQEPGVARPRGRRTEKLLDRIRGRGIPSVCLLHTASKDHLQWHQ